MTAFAPENLLAVYHDAAGQEHTQPVSDITEAGTLIDPDTGDDMQIAEVRVTSRAGDDYIIVSGGLVQNNPTLPIFDLDILDLEFPDAGAAHEAFSMIEQMHNHPGFDVEETSNAEDLDNLAEFVRSHGRAALIAELDTFLADRSTES